MFLCAAVPATIAEEPVSAQASPHISRNPACSSNVTTRRPALDGEAPSPAGQSQLKAKERRTLQGSTLSHWEGSLHQGEDPVLHAHTGHLWWCSWLAITLTLPQTKSRLASSPPYSDAKDGLKKHYRAKYFMKTDSFVLAISRVSPGTSSGNPPLPRELKKKK